MRVLHVISALMSGGAESMLVNLVRAQPAPRHEHIIACLLPEGGLRDAAIDAGARIIDLNAPRSLRAVGVVGTLRRMVHEVAPDLIQGWMYHGNLAASAAAGGRPVIWNVRQTLNQLRDNKPLTASVILACVPFAPWVRRIIYNSTLAAAQHERYGYPARKRLLIPNGFDLTRFRPRDGAPARLRAELGLPDDALIVGRVARDAAMKDHATLFAAFDRIAAALPAARLVCVGRGMTADTPHLRHAIIAHGLTGRVHLLGERRDIPELTAGFDIALSSSAHSEGFANVIGEAMACCVPVVATSIGDAREILGDAARLVPPGDAAALAARATGLLQLTGTERHAIGERDRARIAERYTLASIAERYAACWDMVVQGAAPPPRRPDRLAQATSSHDP